MKTIQLLSNEKNKLIRMLENYEHYVRKDKTKTEAYKSLELEDIYIIRRRIMGQAPKENYVLSKGIDASMLGLGEEDGNAEIM